MGGFIMRKGFSLLEMIIALTIMALIGSIVLPNLKKVQIKSYRMTSEINLRTFQSALENYFLDHSIYPVGSLGGESLYTTLQQLEYMKTCPKNPYTKTVYKDTDSKGKITYYSGVGDDYTLSLYTEDGQTLQLSLGSI